MELNDLNNLLNQPAIRERIEGKKISLQQGGSGDPFGQIKKRCRWIFAFFAFATIVFFPFLMEKNHTLILLLYLALCIEPLISLIGYLQIRFMGRADGNIRDNLLVRIRRLQAVFRSYIFLNAFFYIFLACALEYLIRHGALIHTVFDQFDFPFRLAFYTLFISFQFWQKRRSYLKNYGTYLSALTQLLNQTHEE